MDEYFYCHTNDNAEDFKIERCDDLLNQKWEDYIPAKDEVLIGGLIFLNNWILRGEKSNALGKLFVKNRQTGVEVELNLPMRLSLSPEFIDTRDKNTDLVYLSLLIP